MKLNTTFSLVCIFLLIFSLFYLPLQAREAREEDIKAVYLYNFLRFITWPKQQASTSSVAHKNTVTICILGKDKAASYQHSFRGVEGQLLKSDQRKLVVKRFDSLESIKNNQSCQLIFITASEQSQYQKIINLLSNHMALLVGETPDFLKLGGMVIFHRVKDKIRWKINLTSTTSAGFKIDRRLLRSATEVVKIPLNKHFDDESQNWFYSMDQFITLRSHLK